MPTCVQLSFLGLLPGPGRSGSFVPQPCALPDCAVGTGKLFWAGRCPCHYWHLGVLCTTWKSQSRLETAHHGNWDAVSAAECEESQAVPARRACTQIRWAGAQGGQTAALFGVLLSCLSSLFKSFVRPVMHVPITLTTAFTAFLAVLLRTWRQCLCNALSMLTAESHV